MALGISGFLIPLSVLLLSLLGGIYFFVRWAASKSRPLFLLYWAYGLGLLFWFKLPNILLNQGVKGLDQYDLYPFFFVTLVIHFVAYVALLQGIVFFRKTPHTKTYYHWMLVWLAIAVVYFALCFFAPGFDVTYTPVWASHLLFFIPVKLLLLYELWYIAHPSRGIMSIPRVGIVFAVLADCAALVSSTLYVLVQTLSEKRELWLYSSLSSAHISLVQVVVAMMLLTGLSIFMRAYFQTVGKRTLDR